ncbi:MAG TPA: NUDIX hydrolase [Anaerolineales bacterium]
MTHHHGEPAPIHYCPVCATAVEQRQAFGRARPVCPACGWVHFADPKVAVAIFLVAADGLLLVQRRHEPMAGAWSLPAGFVEAGEDPRQAAQRECLEETGLQVIIGSLHQVFYGRQHAAGADLLLVFEAELVAGDLRPSDDASQAAFFGASELPGLAFESTNAVAQAWASPDGML